MPKLKLTSSLLWPIVVLAIAFGAFYFKPWQTNNKQTVAVTAEGKAQAKPDVAQITANVQTNNPNIDTARAQNEQKVSSIVGKLKELGIEEKDIKTQNITAGEGYEPQTLIYPAPPKPNTNTFSTALEITVRNFDIADEVLATLTQNGATNIYGPNLTLSEETKETAKSEARKAAIENAKKKAEELAKLSGRKVGKAITINEQGDAFYPSPVYARSEIDLKQSVSQIQPGQDQVTVAIQVDFELK